jgi:hypothetical protein
MFYDTVFYFYLFILSKKFSLKNVSTKTRAPKMCTNLKYLKNILQTNKKKTSMQESTFSAFKETPELPLHFTCPYSKGARVKIAHQRDPNLNALLSTVCHFFVF